MDLELNKIAFNLSFNIKKTLYFQEVKDFFSVVTMIKIIIIIVEIHTQYKSIIIVETSVIEFTIFSALCNSREGKKQSKAY